MTLLYQIQLRNDTAANWTSVNPVLLAGEVGVETDTLLFKIGNGVSHWASLPYVTSLGTLTGDVTGTPTATVVSKVGGATASSVASGAAAANAATSADAPSTIVSRDSSGNFSAGTITASLTGHASLDVPLSQVGAASGVAPLDSSGKVPAAYLPASVFVYQGTWNPGTNSPTLVDGTGTTGYTYWVSAAHSGTVSGLSNASMTNFQVGDLVLYNGSQWELTTPAAGVQSVNAATGAVTVNAISQLTGDVTTSAASGSQAEASTVAKIQGTTVSGTTGTGDVVFATSPAIATPTLTDPVQAGYEDFTEISTPATPTSGTLRVYAKSDDNLYAKTSGGVEKQIGSGGGGTGSGEKNYVASSAQSTAATWATSSSNITVATDTTAADLPRAITTGSGIKLTGVSGNVGTEYAYLRFTLDPADYGVKLKVQFAMNALAGYVANDFRVDVYSNTASNYSGTYTRLPLSTDSSGVSGLPLVEGTYQTTFDAPGALAQWIELRIGLNSINTHSLVLSDLIVGPGVVGTVIPGQSAGLVPATGLPGNTTGSAAPAGTVGEVTQGSGTATGSTSYTGLTSTVLTPGVWVATAVVQATGGSSGGSYVEAIINQTQNSGTGTQGYNYVRGSVGSTGEGSAVIPFYLINIPQGSGSQTYWLNCRTDHTAASDIAYRVNYVRIY